MRTLRKMITLNKCKIPIVFVWQCWMEWKLPTADTIKRLCWFPRPKKRKQKTPNGKHFVNKINKFSANEWIQARDKTRQTLSKEEKKLRIHVRIHLLETKTISNSKTETHHRQDVWYKSGGVCCACWWCLVYICIFRAVDWSYYLILAVGYMSLVSEVRIITYLGISVSQP